MGRSRYCGFLCRPMRPDIFNPLGRSKKHLPTDENLGLSFELELLVGLPRDYRATIVRHASPNICLDPPYTHPSDLFPLEHST